MMMDSSKNKKWIYLCNHFSQANQKIIQLKSKLSRNVPVRNKVIFNSMTQENYAVKIMLIFQLKQKRFSLLIMHLSSMKNRQN